MKRKTVYTLLCILFVLSFFVTPLGDWGKSGLMRLFAFPPEIIAAENQQRLSSYDWRLRDGNGAYFNFKRSRGKVAFVDFWATWHTPSASELRDIQKLYNAYRNQVDFYIVTNEERYPVGEFMEKKEYTFPITYRIVDEPAPFQIPEPSGAYLIDKKGNIVVESHEIKDWYNDEVTLLLDSLVSIE
ncbi:MAG TPA: TlpA disulfide reductase family protein [Pricia sp.]|nr:TlpA disulfide reductase family protein [Pricia sp.]